MAAGPPTYSDGSARAGPRVVATRDRDENLYVAVRDAFESATRQVEGYARQLRPEVQAHSLHGR